MSDDRGFGDDAVWAAEVAKLKVKLHHFANCTTCGKLTAKNGLSDGVCTVCSP